MSFFIKSIIGFCIISLTPYACDFINLFLPKHSSSYAIFNFVSTVFQIPQDKIDLLMTKLSIEVGYFPYLLIILGILIVMIIIKKII